MSDTARACTCTRRESVLDDELRRRFDDGEETEEVVEEPTPESPEISFSADISPIMEFRCVDCHGTDGGYDASTYDLVVNSGDNGPAVIPGDAENSLLVQKISGTHAEGDLMPPPPLRALQEDLIQLIIDWINAGAPDN